LVSGGAASRSTRGLAETPFMLAPPVGEAFSGAAF
jgi:hypothetical protein